MDFEYEPRHVAAAFGVAEFTETIVEDGEDGHWCYYEGLMTEGLLCRWEFSFVEKELLGFVIGRPRHHDETFEVYFDVEGFLVGKYQRREDAWGIICMLYVYSQQMAKALCQLGWEAELIERLIGTRLTAHERLEWSLQAKELEKPSL